MIRLLILLSMLSWAGSSGAQDRQPNHLLGAQSPYLLQHLYNPVDWYPWGEEALEKARLENKLIFVSVGYSSCYWCHVMREESFENPEIAAFLNKYFVSIKIDRERRPDLDEQFMLATQVLTGSGGWPNNVILTPLGDPVFGGTYFPPDAFLQVLTRVSTMWQEEPAVISAEGFRLARHLRQYLNRTAAATELTPALLSQITTGLLGRMDVFNGGLGTAPKFPRESLFLFLLDQARRSGDPALFAPVSDMLNGMIRGGIHDQVGGGFHRYAIDPEWHVPHFEKMLYNQAMIGLLLARSHQATGNPDHARALERLVTYTLREMRDPGGAFYSAQDAVSEDASGETREGAFYTWTPEQIADAGTESDYLMQVFQISPNGEFEGANVLHLPADLPDYARLDPMLDLLHMARENRKAPVTDTKILLGWNGMMIAMLAEAGFVLERPDYWQAGAEAATFLLNELRTEQGFLRVVFDGNAGVPAQLPDLGAFALGLIALHDYAPTPGKGAYWLETAREVAEAIRSGFGTPDEGFRMTAATDGFSPIMAVDDGEIPSGNALALLTFTRLSRRAALPEFALDAQLLSAALSGHVSELSEQRAASLAAILELRDGETGPVRYVSGGAVRVEMLHDRLAGQVRFRLSIKPGWHINAHVPLEAYFIPTTLVVDDAPLPARAYPEPVVKSLGFSDNSLALYESTLTLVAPLPEAPATAVLTLQACSEEICLEPEELTFSFW